MSLSRCHVSINCSAYLILMSILVPTILHFFFNAPLGSLFLNMFSSSCMFSAIRISRTRKLSLSLNSLFLFYAGVSQRSRENDSMLSPYMPPFNTFIRQLHFHGGPLAAFSTMVSRNVVAFFLALILITASAQNEPIVLFGSVPVQFLCFNAITTFGQSVYVTGSVAELGLWDRSRAVKLSPNPDYPLWKGTIRIPLLGTPVAWKCLKRSETDPDDRVEYEPDPNNEFRAINCSGTCQFTAYGNFPYKPCPR